jgi:hypothetical protein
MKVKYKDLPLPVKSLVVDNIGLVIKRHLLTNNKISYEYLQYEIQKVLSEHTHMFASHIMIDNGVDIIINLILKHGGEFNIQVR